MGMDDSEIVRMGRMDLIREIRRLEEIVDTMAAVAVEIRRERDDARDRVIDLTVAIDGFILELDMSTDEVSGMT
jgi:hypothetical protein